MGKGSEKKGGKVRVREEREGALKIGEGQEGIDRPLENEVTEGKAGQEGHGR